MGTALDRLTIADTVELGAAIRTAGTDASSMEEVANTVVRLICDATTSDDSDPSCTLVRCFVTDEGPRLPPSLSDQAGRLADDPGSQFLVLLATEGAEPAWCDRRQSQGHQVIPLVSEELVATYPMVSRMFRQFGVPVSALVERKLDSFLDPSERAFGVFHVETADSSPYLTDPQFVREYGVASVVAFGAPLPTGDIFAVLIFSRVEVTREVALLLQPLALSMKIAFLSVLERVFAHEVAPERTQPSPEARLRVEAAALRSLLDVEKDLIADRYRSLEALIADTADSELTPRETDILHLVATGATNKQIAANLDLSAGTVKWHLYNLFQKLGAETRTEAVMVAQQRGLIN